MKYHELQFRYSYTAKVFFELEKEFDEDTPKENIDWIARFLEKETGTKWVFVTLITNPLMIMERKNQIAFLIDRNTPNTVPRSIQAIAYVGDGYLFRSEEEKLRPILNKMPKNDRTKLLLWLENGI